MINRLLKSDRLLNAYDFERLKSDSNVVKTPYFLFIYKKNSFTHARLGLSISKKVGNAVARNYIKRVSRELFRASAFRTREFDLHIIARQKLASANKDSIFDILKQGYQQLENASI